MPTFFEMFEILNENDADWMNFTKNMPLSRRSAAGPVTAPPPPTPTPGVAQNLSVDPQALVGQMNKKRISQNIGPKFPTARTGLGSHGYESLPVNATDALQNRHARAGEREAGPQWPRVNVNPPVPGMGAAAAHANPDEDINPHGRMINKARQGGWANKVGSGEVPALPTDRQALGMTHQGSMERQSGVGTPVDAAVQGFQKAQDTLNAIIQGKNPAATQTDARTLLMRMQDMHSNAHHNLRQMMATPGVDPSKIADWETLVRDMGRELKQYPADLGLTREATEEKKVWAYYSA